MRVGEKNNYRVRTMDDRMADSEMMGNIQSDAFDAGFEAGKKENDLIRMFDDIEKKLKAIVETLQQQIEEMRQSIDEIDKDLLLHEKLFDVHHKLWLNCKSRIEALEKK